MRIQKIMAAVLAAATVFSCTVFAAETYATRGEVAKMLETAADDYNPNVTYADILKGDETGELHEEDAVTRAEALVMLSRAFGPLPELTGHNARVALKSDSFTDIPDWAKEELAPVLDKGIAAGTADGIFSPDEYVTADQMQLFIGRVYALFGTNEKDDFYAAVNKDSLNQMELLPGRASTGALYALNDKAGAEVASILDEVLQKGGEKGSKEQKMADFYKNILDTESRNKVGIAPIQKYLDMINTAADVNDLMKAQSALCKEIAFTPFIGFSITIDMKDSTKYIPAFGTLEPMMSKDFYATADEAQKSVYTAYLTKLLTLAGETPDKETVDAYYQYEKTLSKKVFAPGDRNNVDKIYNTVTLDEICAMFPNIDVKTALADSGVKEEAAFYIENPEYVRAYAALFTDDNLDVLKTAAKLALLYGYGGALSTDFVDAANEFNAAYLGVSGSYTNEELAVMIVSNIMPDYIGEIYAEKYFSEEAKQNVEQMVQDIISAYEERIRSLDWMSPETKQKALRKLETMTVKIGYPDSFDTYLDDVDIRSAAEGGSYFLNMVEIAKASRKAYLECQGQPVDKTAWLMYPYTVNACYSATSNDITFPAAILQSPMYDVNASYEENLGGIGYIIAHEITHAFDNNGAKFDENGNAADWWTESDYAAFEERCEKMVAFYDQKEGIPGVPMDGRQTLSENVSDQGAMQCLVSILAKRENPDYKTFYRSVANIWASTKTRPYAKYVAGMDVHSEDKLRTNLVIVNTEEFFKTFGITEKDGMWVSPEDRVRIW